ncbi:MAG: DNA/RNA non-specific endonuclease [Erythrobacter sp.]
MHGLREIFRAEDIREMQADLRDIGAARRREMVLEGRGRGEPVYIVPGILGSELSHFEDGDPEKVWLNLLGIPFGRLKKLIYGPNDQIEATDASRSTYLPLKLKLTKAGYSAEYLPYDWRDPVQMSAQRLFEMLSEKHSNPVTLVCHSMGGLVARAIAGLDPDRQVVKQVITLGTPNLGSYAPFSLIRGTNKLLQWLALADPTQSAEEIVADIIRHWPGLVEMLPRPLDDQVDLFDRGSWPARRQAPLQRLLTQANTNQAQLPAPDSRFVQVIGFGHSTIQSVQINGTEVSHQRSNFGDGTVSIAQATYGAPAKTYFVESPHGSFPNTPIVKSGIIDILQEGATELWLTRPPESVAFESVDKTEEQDLGDVHSAYSALSDFIAVPGEPGIRADGMVDGYPVPVIERAARVYEEHAETRAKAHSAAIKGDIFASETEERVRLYAKRMLKLSKKVVEAEGAETRDRQPNMTKAMERMAFEQAPDVDLAADGGTSADKAMEGLQLEAVLRETEDFLSVFYFKRAQVAVRSIGRVRERDSDFGFGTGFMIAPGLFMTNNHVLQSSRDASRAVVEFDYELDVNNRTVTAQEFRFRPSECFVTNSSLDFTIVAVEPVSRRGVRLEEYLYLPLNGTEGKIRAFAPVNIVQHPDGRRKEVVFRDSMLQSLPADPDAATHFDGSHADSVLHHTGDTLPGSSGAPCLNDWWEVIGLHNSAIPERDENGFWVMTDGTSKPYVSVTSQDSVKWISNQAIRISRIVHNLRISLQEKLIPEAFVPHIECVLKVGLDAERDGLAYRHFGGQLPGTVNAPNDTRSSPEANLDRAAQPAPQSTTVSEQGTIRAQAEFANPADINIRIGVDISANGTVASIRDLNSTAAHDFSEVFERRRRASDYVDRVGYNPDFLKVALPLPTLSARIADQAAVLKDGSGTQLRYSNFSVVMNGPRKLAFYSIGNFDPQAPHQVTRGKDPWALDPRLGREHQATNFYYRSNDLDRGHLFRRLDGAWGETRAVALKADHDTYHWTNIAPQHEVFNQSKLKPTLDLWGQLENEVTRVAKQRNTRATIINGPIFDDDNDPMYRGLQVPLNYWKIIAHNDDDGIKVYAFVLEQSEFVADIRAESRAFEDFEVNQLSVRALGEQTGIDFGEFALFDVLSRKAALEKRSVRGQKIKITSAQEILI